MTRLAADKHACGGTSRIEPDHHDAGRSEQELDAQQTDEHVVGAGDAAGVRHVLKLWLDADGRRELDLVAKRASDVFQGIEEDTGKVAALLDEMAAAAAEVSSQADSVNVGLRYIAANTSDSVGEAERLAELARSSESNVRELERTAAGFRV